MRNIDFENVGMGILIACCGIGFVISDISDAERAKECDKRGGVIQRINSDWFAPKACVATKEKP